MHLLETQIQHFDGFLFLIFCVLIKCIYIVSWIFVSSVRKLKSNFYVPCDHEDGLPLSAQGRWLPPGTRTCYRSKPDRRELTESGVKPKKKITKIRNRQLTSLLFGLAQCDITAFTPPVIEVKTHMALTNAPDP